MDIGFPFSYYKEFWMKGNNKPNSGWNLFYLSIDFFFTFIFLLTIKWLNSQMNLRKRTSAPSIDQVKK